LLQAENLSGVADSVRRPYRGSIHGWVGNWEASHFT